MTFQKRKYQQDAIKNVTTHMIGENPDHANKIIYQLPTGGGKTYIATQVCKAFTDQIAQKAGFKPTIYWVTHRRELEKQSAAALAEIGIYNFQVSSPIKFFNRIKRNEIRPTRYSLFIVDECHHATAPTWERLIRTWPGPVLGLTATPWRLSKKEGFDHLFHNLWTGPSVQQLIDWGYLVPTLLKAAPRIIKGFGNIGGEYSGKQIMEQNSRDVLIEGAIRWLLDEMGNQSRVLIYASSVEHCEQLQACLINDHCIESAVLLGKTPTEERDEIVKAFKSGEVRILINFNVLTEGFDVPEADMCMILRPTKSLALYLQMIGRVIRASDDKLYAVVLDSTDNHVVHGLPEQDREWSLEPRVNYEDSDRSGGFMRRCIFCSAVLHAAKRECTWCEKELGFKCERCGKFTWWRSMYEASTMNQCTLCTEEVQNLILSQEVDDQVLRPCLLGGSMQGQIGVIYEGKDYPKDLLSGTRIIVAYENGQQYDHIKAELARTYNKDTRQWKMVYSTWKNHQLWVLGHSATSDKVIA